MDGAGTRIAGAMRSGAAFAAEAWKDAWAPLSLIALGQGAAFACAHLDVANPISEKVQMGGWLLSALALLPALGALYRSAIGGAGRKELGPGGLQLKRAEGSIVLVLILLGMAAVACLAPMLLVGGAIWYPLRDAGVIRVPALGPFGLWFFVAGPVLLLAGGAAFVALSRLALALPAAVAEPRLDLMRVMRGSKRWSGSLAWSFFLTDVLPLMLVIALVQGLIQLEKGQAGGLPGAVWPTPDAIGASVVLSLLCAFVLLPMSVGARTYFYGRVLAEQRAAQRRRAALEAQDKPAKPVLTLVKTDADDAASEDGETVPSIEEAEGETPLAAEAELDGESEKAAAAASEEGASEEDAAPTKANSPDAPEPSEVLEPEGAAAAAEEVGPAPPEPPGPPPPAPHHDFENWRVAAASSSTAAGPPPPAPQHFGLRTTPPYPAAPYPAAPDQPAARAAWSPPVEPLRGVGMAQAVTTPMLLAHANDREHSPPWWLPPGGSDGPTVA